MSREANKLLVIVLALTLIGIVMVYSASAIRVTALAPEEDGWNIGYLGRHLLYAAIGIFGMLVAIRFDYHHLAKPGLYRTMVIVTMILLALVLLRGLGHTAGGAQRWLRVPGTPFKFQPSEFAKGVLVILLAVKLSVNQGDIKSFTRGFLPAIGLTFVFAVLVLLENDLGIPVVMGTTAFLMIFMAGTRWIYVIASTVMGAAGVAAIALTTPHRIERLVAFRDPWRYAQDSGFQLIQSLAAFARGSVLGQGIGGSEQKLFYLPASHTDFIFAVWGEEAGLVGTLLVVVLFAAFLAVALRVSLCAPDLFGTLLAAGIAGLVGVEAALNMGVTTGLLPTKGLPLPFISYGGSALIANLTMVGVLINIALQSSEEEAESRFATARA